MPRPRTVLVIGATGKQGGAVARSLLARGQEVVALTRTPDSTAARELARLGGRIAKGDFGEPASLKAAMRDIDSVFVMGTPFQTSPDDEVRQGMAAIEAAIAAHVGHVIYSSVASADQMTGVPHFDSKFEVEQRLQDGGLNWTICAPVAFMDFLAPHFLDGLRVGELRMAMPGARPLHYVAVADIGAFVAELVERREAVFGQRIEIAADERTGEEAAAILSHASGRDIRYVSFSPDLIRTHNEDVAAMFEWFDRVGYGVDRAKLRATFPDLRWRSLKDWAREQDWKSAFAETGGDADS